jgi:hypothetical protein
MSDEVKPVDLAEIRARAKVATPPYPSDNSKELWDVYARHGKLYSIAKIDVPAMAREIERLRARIAELEASIENDYTWIGEYS